MTLTEQVFRKMGWELHIEEELDNDDGHHKKHVWWNTVEGNHHFALWFRAEEAYKHLPPIDSQWEVTAKWLVPFMREKNWLYRVTSLGTFAWHNTPDFPDDGIAHKAEIKDDNIAEAACKTFMEVEL